MKKLFALMVAVSLAAIGCEDKKTSAPKPADTTKATPKVTDPPVKAPDSGSRPKDTPKDTPKDPPKDTPKDPPKDTPKDPPKGPVVPDPKVKDKDK